MVLEKKGDQLDRSCEILKKYYYVETRRKGESYVQ